MTPIEIEKTFRDEAGRALATLIRLVGDFDLAEDALQEAFAVALERWPAAAPPSNPRAGFGGGTGTGPPRRPAIQSAGVAGECRTQQGDRQGPPANRVSRQAGRAGA